MREIGTRDVDLDFANTIRIQEWNKPHILKLYDGPAKVHSIFYPYVDDEGKFKTGMFTIPDWKSNPLARFAEIDLAIQKEAIVKRFGGESSDEAKKEIKKLRSQFNPNIQYHYLGLDKSDDIPLVRRVQVGFTVKTELDRIESESYTDPMGNVDQARMQYGRLFMLWVDIRRIKKDPKGGETMFNTDYSVRVVDEYCQKFKGKFPSTYKKASLFIDDENKAIILRSVSGEMVFGVDELVRFGMFTEQEFEALLNFQQDIRSLSKPMTTEEIMEKLQHNPIALNGKNKNGEFLYPSWEQIAEKAQQLKLDVPFSTNSGQLAARNEEPEEPVEEKPKKSKSESKPEQKQEEEDDFEAFLNKPKSKKEWNPAV